MYTVIRQLHVLLSKKKQYLQFFNRQIIRIHNFLIQFFIHARFCSSVLHLCVLLISFKGYPIFNRASLDKNDIRTTEHYLISCVGDS